MLTLIQKTNIHTLFRTLGMFKSQNKHLTELKPVASEKGRWWQWGKAKSGNGFILFWAFHIWIFKLCAYITLIKIKTNLKSPLYQIVTWVPDDIYKVLSTETGAEGHAVMVTVVVIAVAGISPGGGPNKYATCNLTCALCYSELCMWKTFTEYS